jgi:hypothetical protein
MLLLSKRKGSTVDADRMNLPQGSLDLLVLKTLALEPLHGWAVSERLGQMSGRAVQVRQGSFIRPCTGSREEAGSAQDGAPRKTIDAPSITS